jgi:hypothetical protein
MHWQSARWVVNYTKFRAHHHHHHHHSVRGIVESSLIILPKLNAILKSLGPSLLLYILGSK